VEFRRVESTRRHAGQTFSNRIEIYNVVDKNNKPLHDYVANNLGFVVHELGHAFDNALCNITPGCKQPGGNPGRNSLTADLGRDDHGNRQNDFHGFAGGWDVWQYGATHDDGEVFADMYLGWTYNQWGVRTDTGANRANHMNTNMPLWLIALSGQ
jgi:hypothetical protein